MSTSTLPDTPSAAPPAPPAALKDDSRIGPRAHLRHISALIRRNLLWIRQNPESILDAVLMPIIFALLFVFVFGGAIAGDRDTYVDYVIPGLMAMMGLSVAMGVGTGFSEDIHSGVMDRFRTLPIARSSVLIAKIVVELGRMLVAVAILLCVGFALGLSVDNVPGLFAAVGLAAVFGSSLMWVFLALGVTLPNAQSVQQMGMLVMIPLQFGSSIFVPTSTMPGWLQSFADYNPLSALADSARALMNGGPLTHHLVVVLVWSAAITLIMAPMSLRKFRPGK
ncbi:ABC transporter permease [Streptomyces sp. NPDC049906]|uniref:ABC transporter permease n=1 Tax=Streptomyces sp. NPDC049906 TaxID=3155656 RepID=UPI00341CB7A5